MDLLLFLDWCSKLRHLFITDELLKNLKTGCYSNNVYCYFGAQELSKRPQQSINSQQAIYRGNRFNTAFRIRRAIHFKKVKGNDSPNIANKVYYF